VPAGIRTATRLRGQLAIAVEDGRDQAEVAGAHGVSWPTAQRAVIAHARGELTELAPTPVLGLDETRFRRVGWIADGLHDDGRLCWGDADPWETGFVDLAGGQALPGQLDLITGSEITGSEVTAGRVT
jgi:hypothetical protein